MEFKQLKGILDRIEYQGIKDAEMILYHEGKEVFRDKRNPSTPEGLSLANIYSCSKFITCVTALKLYEEGKLSLDDDVSEYLPSFGDIKVSKNGGVYRAEKRMKIKHLFTMTAGFNYDHDHPEIKRGIKETNGVCPTLKMAEYLSQIPLCFEPGESWDYSLCHDVIPALVEVISGERVGHYIKRNIFDPLSMDSATYSLPNERLNEVCPQYKQVAPKEYEEIGPEIVYYKFGSEYESGGAGCVCKPVDYIKFLEGLRTGRIISKNTLELMSRDFLNDSQRRLCTAPSGYGYGLGVRVPCKDGKRTDIGWGGAAGAYAALDVKSGISLYYSQHTIWASTDVLRRDMIEAAKLDLGFDAHPYEFYNK